MSPIAFDHIAIGAQTLDDGVDAMRSRLSIDMPAGGAHLQMGTHNRLMSLGGSSYLEIIAIDPSAPPPDRPRWFALDTSDQERLLADGPRPIAWIARTPCLDVVLSNARAAGLDLGRPVEMTRGDLRWRIGIRDDGLLPQGGTVPMIIEWPDGPHPARRMTDLGFRLQALRLAHPRPADLRSMLRAIGGDALEGVDILEGREPSITCDLRSPACEILAV